MKLFAPVYYEKFKCIAERCRHSCCVGWEIDVDRDAICRYESLGEAGREILGTLDFSEKVPHFRLLPNERCPHLDSLGLCRIISRHGEEYLCDICREHPRFYNFPKGRCEVGLGAACEEAARLILECESYKDTVCIGDALPSENTAVSFDAVSERARVYEFLSDKTIPYSERLSIIYREYGVSPLSVSDSDWRSVISDLEYIDGGSREEFLSYSSESAALCEEYAERALAYFIYRHTGSAQTRAEFLLSLGASLFLERLFVSVAEKRAAEDADAYALILRLISEEIEYCEDNIDIIKNEFL